MRGELDPSTKLGARALERLEMEPIGRLTTINPDSQPQASAVWFVWPTAIARTITSTARMGIAKLSRTSATVARTGDGSR